MKTQVCLVHFHSTVIVSANKITTNLGPGTYAAEMKQGGPMKEMMSNSFSTKVSSPNRAIKCSFSDCFRFFRFQGSAQQRQAQAVTNLLHI